MVHKIVAVLPQGGEVAKNKEYLNCVENCLGLPEFLKEKGLDKEVDLKATSDKDGDDSEVDKLLGDAEIVVTTPFHPAYLTRARIERAKNLKLIITAGVGSDHIDLHAAADNGMTVAEVTDSNVESVAEDEVMRMLILIRNFLKGYHQSIDGEWDVPKIADGSYDLKEKTIGTVGGGRIGYHVMKRLQGWDINRLYYGRHEKPDMDEMGVKLVKDLDEFLHQCDVVTINVPLTDSTRGMFNKQTIGKMKKGAYLVNNARGAICDTDAVAEACKSGQLGGYSGDVWPQQPAPKDHPWRHMPNHAMTPHISGTTLDAQKRYAGGAQSMIEAYLNQRAFKEDWYIVREGKLASQYT